MTNTPIKTILLVLAAIPLSILASFALALGIVLFCFDNGGDMRAIGQAVIFLLLGLAISSLLMPLSIFLSIHLREYFFKNALLYYGTLNAGLAAAASMLIYILT